MELVKPSNEYEVSYISYLAELGDEPRIPFPLTFPCQPFSELVIRLAAESQGVGLPEGFVANSTYWLVRGDRILGVSNLRHSLNPALMQCGGHIGYGVRPTEQGRGVGKEILRLTLLKARSRGIVRVLLTCDQSNAASRGVILANGGVLENEVADPHAGRATLRYWIDLRGG
jgi:predicted acetyltransferase